MNKPNFFKAGKSWICECDGCWAGRGKTVASAWRDFLHGSKQKKGKSLAISCEPQRFEGKSILKLSLS